MADYYYCSLATLKILQLSVSRWKEKRGFASFRHRWAFCVMRGTGPVSFHGVLFFRSHKIDKKDKHLRRSKHSDRDIDMSDQLRPCSRSPLHPKPRWRHMTALPWRPWRRTVSVDGTGPSAMKIVQALNTTCLVACNPALLHALPIEAQRRGLETSKKKKEKKTSPQTPVEVWHNMDWHVLCWTSRACFSYRFWNILSFTSHCFVLGQVSILTWPLAW